MTSISLVLIAVAITIFEAIAHSALIAQLWAVPMNNEMHKLNRTWHIMFSAMWVCLWTIMLILNPWLAALSISNRCWIFPITINIMLGNKPLYLSDVGVDGWVKRNGLKIYWFVFFFLSSLLSAIMLAIN
jgi:hypothetical protein